MVPKTLKIDFENSLVFVEDEDREKILQLSSPEAFAEISSAWVRAGWDTKYVYSFTWLGRPIIQLPDDILRIQEVIFDLKPDIMIETGVAHGGSLILYASLLKLIGKGRVIGIDIDIRPANRKAINEHFLSEYITLLDGSSTDPTIVAEVRSAIKASDTVLVILDSNHSKAHVLAELEAYAPLVTLNSYIVATDGVMGHLGSAPRTGEDWVRNNPEQAALTFVENNDRFVIEEPGRMFNEGSTLTGPTYWPGAWVKRIR